MQIIIKIKVAEQPLLKFPKKRRWRTCHCVFVYSCTEA